MDEETRRKVEEFFAWRDVERKKHRIMTQSEYTAWVRGGDAISSPNEGGPFPGGLTILLGDGPVILGRTEDRSTPDY